MAMGVCSLVAAQIIASVVVSLAAGATLPVRSVSSWPTSFGNVNQTADGSYSTNWVSSPCRAGAWTSSPIFNAISGACESGFCSSSCDATPSTLVGATDSNPYTGGFAPASHGEGRAWATILVPSGAQELYRIFVRGIWAVNTTLTAISASGDSAVVGVLGPQLNYLELYFSAPSFAVASVRLEAQSIDGVMRGFCYSGVGDCLGFTITEIALQTVDCYEELVFDLGAVSTLQRMNYSIDGATRLAVALSLDGRHFTPTSDLATSRGLRTTAVTGIARWVRIRMFTDPTIAWAKVYVNDVQFAGAVGISTACPSNCSASGTCNIDGTCTCDVGFMGPGCAFAACVPACSANGVCLNGVCQCSRGFSGSTCAAPICPNNCFGNGICTGSGTCACNAGFTGSDCRSQVLVGGVGSPATIATLNYRQLVNASAAPVQTDLYKSQVDATCHFARPFLCPGGACTASIGECSLRRQPAVANQWNESLYAAVNLAASATITTSSYASSAYLINDGKDNTAWQGQSCYPTGYVSYTVVNVALGACSTSPSPCNSSSGGSTATLLSVTDGNTNTAAGLSLVAGRAWFSFQLPLRSTIAAVTLKTSSAIVSLLGLTEAGATVLLGNYSSSWSLVNFDYAGPEIFVAIRVEATSSFSLFEFAVRSDPCSEYAVIDLGSPAAITGLRVRHTTSSASVLSTLYEGSTDGLTWTALRAPVSPALVGSLDVAVTVTLRYVRVRHVFRERASASASIFEVFIFGTGGPYGPAPAAHPNPVSFRDLLGVNGIWAWGGQGWSNLAHEGWGPKRYSKVASHARNYHNWHWDVTDPDNIPDFESMSCGKGTQAQWWLSWDWEYSGWAAAGLEVDVSLQFVPSSFPQSVFTHPFAAAYNYGFAFASHFGRNGVNLVSTVEVGNEPWTGYDASFYSTLILGFAQGAKAADPALRVLPAAFSSLADLLARVNATHVALLDGLNVHAYSWIQTTRGRTGVYPEHNMSTLNSVNSLLNFRDAVLPGLPVHLTEWGWDSAGGGQSCDPPPERSTRAPFPECVSERSQALYAVRGALVLARKGLSRATWYFYANTDLTSTAWDSAGGTGVFARSGLISTESAGFKHKQAMFALEHFVQTLGSTTFLSSLQENAEGFVYILGTQSGTPTHIVSWLPIDGDSNTSASLTFNTSFGAQRAWYIGLKTHTAAPMPSVSGSDWTLQLSAVPVVVALSSASWTDVSCGIGGTSVNGTCVCMPGYQGPTCSLRTCDNSCWQRGSCNDGVCTCFNYLTTAGSGEYQRCRPENLLSSGSCRDAPATYDSDSACFLNQCPNSCNFNGICTSQGCVCNNGYSGAACELLPCHSNCRSHGSCNNGTCLCDSGFTGASCEWAVSSVLTRLSNAAPCNAAKPFTCPDGACVVARGACVANEQSMPVYDPAPFVPVSMAAGAITTSSSSTSNSAAVVDGSESTLWQSAACFPTGYVTYTTLNVLAAACANGRCSAAGMNAATDTNTETSAGIAVLGGLATLVVNLASPATLASVTVKTSSSAPVTVKLLLVPSSGNASVVLLGTSASYTLNNFSVPSSAQAVAAVSLESTASFTVFEVAARTEVCSEFVAVDLGSLQTVAGLTIRHWAGSIAGVAESLYEGSTDGASWFVLQRGLSPYVLGSIDLELEPPVAVRFVRVRHVLQEGVTVQVYVWEIAVWGIDGKYGPAPDPVFNALSFRELLGINGIWGWGSNSYSSSLNASSRLGPWTFAPMASHARNYHNWNWDVDDPDTSPAFDDMVPRGSTRFGDLPSATGSQLAQAWLNWDNEYTTWRRSLEVEVSVQFTTDMFPLSVWDSPYAAGFAYGSRFARHFGSANGTGDVSTVEVGNEPWIAGMGFSDPAFYRAVLLGMARGVKAVDPAMRVLPAAFGSLADLLSRVNATHVALLDGLNVHAYSWIQTTRGRTGVYPEHNMSSLQSLNSFLRFRDAVLPGLPIYLTEWGWDSAGGGQTCDPPPERSTQAPFPECVSERSQALYAVRGALVLARKGLSRATWYFYANTDLTSTAWDSAGGTGVFARSGLVAVNATRIVPKLAYYALQTFVALLGSARFLSAVREDRDAFVYVLGSNADRPAFVVAWLPTWGDSTIETTVTFSSASFGFAAPTTAYRLGGWSPVVVPLPTTDTSSWTLTLSAAPVVVLLDNGTLSWPSSTPSSATASKSPSAEPQSSTPTGTAWPTVSHSSSPMASTSASPPLASSSSYPVVSASASASSPQESSASSSLVTLPSASASQAAPVTVQVILRFRLSRSITLAAIEAAAAVLKLRLGLACYANVTLASVYISKVKSFDPSTGVEVITYMSRSHAGNTLTGNCSLIIKSNSQSRGLVAFGDEASELGYSPGRRELVATAESNEVTLGVDVQAPNSGDPQLAAPVVALQTTLGLLTSSNVSNLTSSSAVSTVFEPFITTVAVASGISPDSVQVSVDAAVVSTEAPTQASPSVASDSLLSVGVVAGIAIAGVLFISCVIAVLVIRCKRKATAKVFISETGPNSDLVSPVSSLSTMRQAADSSSATPAYAEEALGVDVPIARLCVDELE